LQRVDFLLPFIALERTSMNDPFRILITDRNRHVREFLEREFRGAGYQTLAAKDGQEVLALIETERPPDLLILDLEMPHGDGLEILQRLMTRLPPLPVVVHAFLAEHSNQAVLEKVAALVEKKGDTNCLKTTVMEVLKKHYPSRFAGMSRSD
jgi:CheY-like chemotaxis protein